MACKCNEKTSVLRCTKCGRIQTISHSKQEDPLQKAKTEGRQCRKCYTSEFTIG